MTIEAREVLAGYDGRVGGDQDIFTVDGDIAVKDDDPNLVHLSGTAPVKTPAMYEVSPSETSDEAVSEPEPELQAVGEHAVETVLRSSLTVIDEDGTEVPVVPSEHDRLRFADMTPELFEKIDVLESQRFVALSICFANDWEAIGLLPEGMVEYAERWLAIDKHKRFSRHSTKEKRLRDILKTHKKAGDSTKPWLEEIYAGEDGKLVKKARLVWNNDYSKVTPAESSVTPNTPEGYEWVSVKSDGGEEEY
jgi:hypothetical protein